MRFLFWTFLILIALFRIFIFTGNLPEGKRVRISGVVTSEPTAYTTLQRLKIYGLTFDLPRYPEIGYGDSIVVEGKVEERKLQDPKLIKLESKVYPFSKYREKIIGFYQKNIPEPHASFLSGLTLGSKSQLPVDFWNKLKTTGTAHVVVASGMNVTLVSKFLISVLVLFLPRRKAIPLGIAGIWVYALVSGMDAPIIRASIMGSIVFSAQEAGRISSAWRSLFITALVMLIVKPEWGSDIGFLLSFLSTASILLFEKRIKKLFSFVPRVAREDFSTSLSAQIGVFPVLLFKFGQFNILSPVINALVLWTIAPTTIIGLTAGLTGIIFEPIGRIILYLSYPLSSWFIAIVDLFS